MKKEGRKIVIIRGQSTAGKTTISHALAQVLPGWIFVDIWKIKEMFEHLGLEDRTVIKSASKKAVMAVTKEIMEKLGTNIILQEADRRFLIKRLRSYLKENKYNVYSFFLFVNYDTAIKRDRIREKPTMHIKNLFTRESWKKNQLRYEKEDIRIDTTNRSIQETIDLILKEIGEKRKKHPKAHMIRKAW